MLDFIPRVSDSASVSPQFIIIPPLGKGSFSILSSIIHVHIERIINWTCVHAYLDFLSIW